VESDVEVQQGNLRDEANAKSEDNIQKISQLRDE
jgi:hypothetical protein